MKINSIQQQNLQSFRGATAQKATGFVAKHPELILGLAGCSAVSQKLVMTGVESTMGPAFDLGIGHVLTNMSDDKDERIMQSSKAQAIRSFVQSVGGTITGIPIRMFFMLGSAAIFAKLGASVGSKMVNGNPKPGSVAETVGKLINPDGTKNEYQLQETASAWGKTVGAGIATLTMAATNFILDVPLVNAMNRYVSDKFLNNDKNKEAQDV